MQEVRGFHRVKDEFKKQKGDIMLPIQATKSSVGYDWFCPVDIDIKPQETVVIPTDIKVYMQPDEMLMLVPRSSVGIKHDLMVANTIGIGDSDFYENENNDGNYCIALRNLRPSMKLEGYTTVTVDGQDLNIPKIKDMTAVNTVHIKQGDRIVQGIFVQTLPSDNGGSNRERKGGVGSTGK